MPESYRSRQEVRSVTVLERLKASLEDAARYNPNDADPPVAILWPDAGAKWLPICVELRRILPHLLTLGDYDPEQRIGPSIWLRCVVDRALAALAKPDNATPILYLPGVSRQDLKASTSTDRLKPLVELQYRGVCWTQKNGNDWTVEAFLVSNDGGLGLDVAKDKATRDSMLRALTELATTPVDALRGRRLDSEDFDRLFSNDPIRDLLVWLSDAQGVKARWDGDRWSAFRSQCVRDLQFDPVNDGVVVAAERLGMREDGWQTVWDRFAESPVLYPGIPELLDAAMPDDLFADPQSSWPRNNREGEDALRRALLNLASETPTHARKRIAELERDHGARRSWVWAKVDGTPLADAIGHLAELAERTASELGGRSAASMAELYAGGAWKIDAAALSSMAATHSSADTEAVSNCLDTIYRPWLEESAQLLQSLVAKEPLPGGDRSRLDDIRIGPGTVVFFADGLRFDISHRLADALGQRSRTVALTTLWAALPTVTATAKPAVSPVAKQVYGVAGRCRLSSQYRRSAIDH